MLTKSVVLLTLLTLGLVDSLSTVEEAFLLHKIVPDVLSSPPDTVLKVTFPSGAEVQLGNELTISQVEGTPTLEWAYKLDYYYTVVLIDADPRSRADPDDPAYLHWLRINVSGSDVTSGATIATLLNSHPEPDTGLHRYIFLVFEQPGLVDFQEELFDNFESRKGFSPDAFAHKYALGNAVAGNFYQTQNLGD